MLQLLKSFAVSLIRLFYCVRWKAPCTRFRSRPGKSVHATFRGFLFHLNDKAAGEGLLLFAAALSCTRGLSSIQLQLVLINELNLPGYQAFGLKTHTRLKHCNTLLERRLPYAGNKSVNPEFIMGGQKVLPNTGGRKNAKTDLPMEAVW